MENRAKRGEEVGKKEKESRGGVNHFTGLFFGRLTPFQSDPARKLDRDCGPGVRHGLSPKVYFRMYPWNIQSPGAPSGMRSFQVRPPPFAPIFKDPHNPHGYPCDDDIASALDMCRHSSQNLEAHASDASCFISFEVSTGQLPTRDAEFFAYLDGASVSNNNIPPVRHCYCKPLGGGCRAVSWSNISHEAQQFIP